VTSRLPSVAVVGRQNVGKSTLVNRLLGRRVAIAHDTPGVTRDRLEVEAAWGGRRFLLADTAGYVHKASGVEVAAIEQGQRAIDDADVILFVVDVRAGLTEEDALLARRLRSVRDRVVLAVNKADSPNDVADAAAFNALGFGEPIDVSALHGRNTGDLLDRLITLLPSAEDDTPPPDQPSFAVVGRPNVGKSTLFNRMVGADRAVVSEISGTTRDAVDSVVRWPAGPVRFVDTAGLRRGGRVAGVEYYSFLRAVEAIERADVVLLVIDAAAGLTAEDRRIASRVVEGGRALVVVANKWDLLDVDRDELFQRLRREVRPFARADVVRTSAARGQGVHRLPAVLLDLHQRWSSRAPTATVNEIIQSAQRERPTPRDAGTLHYSTQAASRPPTFVVFGGGRPPDRGYQRYLENRLRSALELEGVPIRLRFRSRSGRGVQRIGGR